MHHHPLTPPAPGKTGPAMLPHEKLLSSGRRQLLSAALVFCLILIGTAAGSQAQEKAAGVSLKVDFGDGLIWHYSRIEHKPKMTVLDAMNELKGRKLQPLAFEFSGRGPNAFLKSLGGVENEGGGRSARNWFFRVGTKLGERSFGITEIAPGDEIIWHFGKYMPEN
jgi:hypothetical protein